MRKALRTKSALSYFGSDSEVAAKLAAMLDGCKHVTIPFAGGLSILPHLTARAVVANDLNCLAINFYLAVSGAYGITRQKQLIDRCQRTLSHPVEMELAGFILENDHSTNVGRAWAFWAQCWVGRKGQGGTSRQGGMPSVRRTASGGSNATRIRAAAGDLEAWAEQFERCEWELIDFRELLPKISDTTGCGAYCDPPWFGAGDSYLHSFTHQDHVDLRDMLSRFKHATVVVRYGDHPTVRDLYDGWDIEESRSTTQAGGKVKELWIRNRTTNEVKDDS